MERFLAPHTSEAQAYSHLTENWFTWDQDHPSFNETLVAGCAAYQALNRFITDADILILPPNRFELESVLRCYARDSIHNAISVSRQTLQAGGYSRICHLANKSIETVLDTRDNADYLLGLHVSGPVSAQNGVSKEGIRA